MFIRVECPRHLSALRSEEFEMTVTLEDGRLKLDDAIICTMRELNQHTAQVLEKANKLNKPVVITKFGRFVALIMPLEGAQIESMVISEGPIAEEIERRATKRHPTSYSTEQMLDEADSEGGERHPE